MPTATFSVQFTSSGADDIVKKLKGIADAAGASVKNLDVLEAKAAGAGAVLAQTLSSAAAKISAATISGNARVAASHAETSNLASTSWETAQARIGAIAEKTTRKIEVLNARIETSSARTTNKVAAANEVANAKIAIAAAVTAEAQEIYAARAAAANARAATTSSAAAEIAAAKTIKANAESTAAVEAGAARIAAISATANLNVAQATTGEEATAIRVAEAHEIASVRITQAKAKEAAAVAIYAAQEELAQVQSIAAVSAANEIAAARSEAIGVQRAAAEQAASAKIIAIREAETAGILRQKAEAEAAAAEISIARTKADSTRELSAARIAASESRFNADSRVSAAELAAAKEKYSQAVARSAETSASRVAAAQKRLVSETDLALSRAAGTDGLAAIEAAKARVELAQVRAASETASAKISQANEIAAAKSSLAYEQMSARISAAQGRSALASEKTAATIATVNADAAAATAKTTSIAAAAELEKTRAAQVTFLKRREIQAKTEAGIAESEARIAYITATSEAERARAAEVSSIQRIAAQNKAEAAGRAGSAVGGLPVATASGGGLSGVIGNQTAQVGILGRAYRSLGGDIKTFDGQAKLTAGTMGALTRSIALFGGSMAALKIINQADDVERFRNRLRVVEKDIGNVNGRLQQLFDISLKTFSPIETTTELYARLALATGDLGLKQSRLLNITESLNKAVAISGSTVQEARNGIIQFTQALASNRLGGDEFRSVSEQNAGILIVLKRELGLTTGELRKFAYEGNITTEVMTRALENQKGFLDSLFDKRIKTVSQSMTNLRTQWIRFVDEMNQSLGVTRAVMNVVEYLSERMDTLGRIAILAGGAILVAFAGAAFHRGLLKSIELLNILNLTMLANPYLAAAAAIALVTTSIILFGDKTVVTAERQNQAAVTLKDYFLAVGDVALEVNDRMAKGMIAIWNGFTGIVGRVLSDVAQMVDSLRVLLEYLGIIQTRQEAITGGQSKSFLQAAKQIISENVPSVGTIVKSTIPFGLEIADAAQGRANRRQAGAGQGPTDDFETNAKKISASSKALDEMMEKTYGATKAQDEFSKFTKILDDALRDTHITLEEYNSMVGNYWEQNKDKLQPMQTLLSSLAEERSLNQLSTREREIQIGVLEKEKVLRALIPGFITDTTGKIREEVAATVDSASAAQIRNGILAETSEKYAETAAKIAQINALSSGGIFSREVADSMIRNLDPLKAFTYEIEKEIDLLKTAPRFRDEDTRVMALKNALLIEGRKLLADQESSVRNLIAAERTANETDQARTAILARLGQEAFASAAQMRALRDLYLAGRVTKEFVTETRKENDPVLKENEAIKEQIRILGFSANQRQIEEQIARRRVALSLANVTNIEAEIAAYRTLITALDAKTIATQNEDKAIQEITGPYTDLNNLLIALSSENVKAAVTTDQLAEAQRNAKITALSLEKDGISGLKQAILELQRDSEDMGTSVARAVGSVFQSLENVFVDFVKGTKIEFADLVGSILEQLARLAFQKFLLSPFLGLFGDGGTVNEEFADGGVFRGSQKIEFMETGRIVDKPEMFTFNRGKSVGVRGEAGPEAILPLAPGGRASVGGQLPGGAYTGVPLKRLAGGKLGVDLTSFFTDAKMDSTISRAKENSHGFSAFADGGIFSNTAMPAILTPTRRPRSSSGSAGGASIVFEKGSIHVEVSVTSTGEGMNEAEKNKIGQQVGEAIDAALDAKMVEFYRTNSRRGGLMNREDVY